MVCIVDHEIIALNESNGQIDLTPRKGTNSSSAAVNLGRRMLSRKHKNHIGVSRTIKPGEPTDGCLVCCASPGCCPCCSLFPCCGDTVDVTSFKKSSQYIYIRENSIEWNGPEVIMKDGPCCGVDPCAYTIQDKVTVVYFDDIMMDRITDKTRCCNEMRTCLFGGKGERLSLDSPICCGACERASSPIFCVPVCCPTSVCPCIMKHEIYLDDAQQGLHDILNSIELCKKSDLYTLVDQTIDRS